MKQLPEEFSINVNFNIKLKCFLKEQKINSVEYKIDKRAFSGITKLCKQMAKLGYEFDLKIDDTQYSYHNGELEKVVEDE